MLLKTMNESPVSAKYASAFRYIASLSFGFIDKMLFQKLV